MLEDYKRENLVVLQQDEPNLSRLGKPISLPRGVVVTYDFTMNETLRVMHIQEVASDQKPVESKRTVYDPSTVCGIYWQRFLFV
jgi:hypothetical protein